MSRSCDRGRWIASLWLCTSLLLVGAAAVRAEPTVLDEPVPLTTVSREGERISGRVTAYDVAGLTLEMPDGQTRPIPWASLRAGVVYTLHQKLLKDAPASAWMALGDLLRSMPDGWQQSNYAYGRAAQLDPTLRDRVQELARQRPPRRTDGDQAAPVPQAAPDPSPALDRPSRAAARGGGAIAGDVPPWPALTDAEHREALERGKAFAERAYQHVTSKLTASETRYFMFYTDLDADEAAKWRSLLDRMYDRMCVMFNVATGTNIWRGKAAVFVFKQEADYRKFVDVMLNASAGQSAGICQQRGDGEVTIAFYRQPRDMEFANILVHESSHGFLHRYRTPAPVQSWANEGLAEWIAADLVPESTLPRLRRSRAREMLGQWRNMGPSFFSARQIVGEQYGIAFTFTEFLISADRARYVEFINGCKAGLDSVDSLERAYGAPLAEIVRAYGKSMGVDNLTPGG